MAKRGSGGAASDAKKRSRKAAAADDDDVDEMSADDVMPEDMEGPETIDDETSRSDARAAVGDDDEEDEAEYRQPMEARRRHARSLSRVANPLVRPRALPDLDGVWDAETRRVMMTTTTMTTTTTMAMAMTMPETETAVVAVARP